LAVVVVDMKVLTLMVHLEVQAVGRVMVQEEQLQQELRDKEMQAALLLQ
jgi:hypothetical protein